MAGRLGNEEPLHRAGLALGEWLLRVLQRKTQGRVPQWRNLLQLEGGPNHHRKLAQSLQHQAPTLCAWLSPAGTARDRTKARPSGHHELISQCVWYKKSVRPIRADEIGGYLQKGFLLRMRGNASGQVNLIAPGEIKTKT